MAHSMENSQTIARQGLIVSVDTVTRVASLRHLAPDGALSKIIRAVFGTSLPLPLRVSVATHFDTATDVILAWRSPTETIVLTRDAAPIDAIQHAVAQLSDGCCIDRSGSFWTIRMTGMGIDGLMARLGSPESMPTPGQSIRSRVADVPVLSISTASGEVLLLVERTYAPHLLNWIQESVRDLKVV
jgi:hypothetical protein